MNGGKDCEGGAEPQAGPVQVPIGWQRRAELASCNGIVYVSPSGSLLSSLEQVKTYLLTDGTCKCGLECPLVLHKVFNFDPCATVKQRTAEDVRADEDVTKLCIHKRKLLAVATLHRSMETHPPLGTAAGASSHRAIRTKPQDSSIPLSSSSSSSSSSSTSSCSSPFKMMISSGVRQQRLYPPQEVGATQQLDPYPGYSRPLRDAAPKSSYRLGYGAMLSPPPPACSSTSSCSAPSPASPCGFSGAAGSPGSSASSLLHSGPPRPPPSCALTGRTSTPLSPTAPAKSPIMTTNPPRGGFHPTPDPPRATFHHQAPQAPCSGLAPLTAPLPCALQKRHVTSEKDPLGILDPIPAKPQPHPHPAGAGPPGFQSPPLLSQVPVMNVNVPPPAVVPLPSNLPLPTVKPAGHAPHLQRTPHPHPSPSPSPSPVTSPLGSAHPRLEASPHRSRSSSTSSDHGGFVPPPPAHPPLKAPPPRSPRPALGSPRPALPPSPSQPQLLGQPLYSPTSSSPSPSPTSSSASSSSSSLTTPHPGLLGVPLNHILTQQSSASFPASSLLSAAAKAQLANQNKVSGPSGGEGGVSLSSGTRGMDGHGALNSMLPPSSALLLGGASGGGEGQSGRAALRDKLMAQQRDPLRRRRQSGAATANHHHQQQPHDSGGGSLVYGMLSKRGPAPPTHITAPSASEQLRKVGRLGSLHPNTSMAQLLQSMSCQSSAQLGPAHRPSMGPTHRPQGMPAQLHYDSPSPPQRLRGPADLLQQQQQQQQQHCQSMEPSRPAHYPDIMAPPQADMNNCSGVGGLTPARSGPLPPPPLSHVGPHPSQQQNHLLHGIARTTSMGALLPHGGGEGNCGPNLSNSDGTVSASSLGCGLGGQMYQQQQLHQAIQQGAPSHLLYQGQQQQQQFSESSTYTESSVLANSTPLPCHYQNYQGMMSHPQFLQDGQQQQQGAELSAGADQQGGAEAVDAIYRAVVDAASRGVHVTITTTVNGTTQAPALSAMSAFAASIGEPTAAGPPPPKSVAATQEGEGLSQQPRPRPPARPGRSHKGLDVGKSTLDGHEAAELFRSPGRRTPRWEAEPLAQGGGAFDNGGTGSGSWGGEEFLECSTQVRSSPASLAPAPPCPAESGGEQHLGVAHLDELAYRYSSCGRPAPPNYKERLEQTVERCAHLNGTAPTPLPFAARSYGDVLTGDDQSPSSSTSLEGPLSSAKDYGHYNGHLNGGSGGMAPSPSDTKSLSSEEELRQPDSPSELLHYRPRAFHMGELVWAPLKGFPPWPASLAGADEQLHAATMQLREQAKVEPEKLKTLTHDLEALDRAAKRGLKPGKLNNHLEAAIHEAMSELDKMSATIPARERQVKLPKPKRRKISR